MKKTPLYHQHVESKAKMTLFSSWSMPLFYKSVIFEHEETRKSVTMFDTSHMGEIRISGKNAFSFIQFLVPRCLSDFQNGQCYYTYLCREDGGILDDLLIYKISDSEFFLVINAGTTDKDELWMKKHRNESHRWNNISIVNESDLWFKIDIQGPNSFEVLSQIIPEKEKLRNLNYFFFDFFEYINSPFIISRTGYTGELGYEIYGKSSLAAHLWQNFLDLKIPPAGLASRDSLRLEMGYPLMNQDLNVDITPLSISKKNLFKSTSSHICCPIEQKEKWILLPYTIESLRMIPRKDSLIFDDNENLIGKVSSGSWSPSLKKSIGLARVDWKLRNLKELTIKTRNHRIKASVCKTPFLKKTSLKNNIRDKGIPSHAKK